MNQKQELFEPPPDRYRTILLTAAKTARASGFSRSFVEAIKGTSGGPFTGRYTTLEKFESWLLANPSFRCSHYWKQRKERLRLEQDLVERVNKSRRSR